MQHGVGEVVHAAVPRWEVFELSLAGPDSGNPFTEVQLGARFVLGRKLVAVDGFYDGMGTYKVRFMPDSEGEWTYTTTSNAPQLDGKAEDLRAWPHYQRRMAADAGDAPHGSVQQDTDVRLSQKL